MLGLSWAEILVIFVVVIICVDPKDIPGMTRKIAETIKKIRAYGNEFTGAISKEIEEPKKFIKGLKGEMQEIHDISDLKEK